MRWKSRELLDFATLQGKTLTSIEVAKGDEHSIRFTADDGKVYVMAHMQDCCESVEIEDVVGDLADIVGTPVLLAEMVESENPEQKPDCCKCEYMDNSNTWTFYKLRTIKGSVDIRWHGSSNGYYSESVSFYEEGANA